MAIYTPADTKEVVQFHMAVFELIKQALEEKFSNDGLFHPILNNNIDKVSSIFHEFIDKYNLKLENDYVFNLGTRSISDLFDALITSEEYNPSIKLFEKTYYYDEYFELEIEGEKKDVKFHSYKINNECMILQVIVLIKEKDQSIERIYTANDIPLILNKMANHKFLYDTAIDIYRKKQSDPSKN